MKTIIAMQKSGQSVAILDVSDRIADQCLNKVNKIYKAVKSAFDPANESTQFMLGPWFNSKTDTVVLDQVVGVFVDFGYELEFHIVDQLALVADPNVSETN